MCIFETGKSCQAFLSYTYPCHTHYICHFGQDTYLVNLSLSCPIYFRACAVVTGSCLANCMTQITYAKKGSQKG